MWKSKINKSLWLSLFSHLVLLLRTDAQLLPPPPRTVELFRTSYSSLAFKSELAGNGAYSGNSAELMVSKPTYTSSESGYRHDWIEYNADELGNIHDTVKEEWYWTSSTPNWAPGQYRYTVAGQQTTTIFNPAPNRAETWASANVSQSWVDAQGKNRSKEFSSDTSLSLHHSFDSGLFGPYGIQPAMGIVLAVQVVYYIWNPTSETWAPAGLIPSNQILVAGKPVDCNDEVIVKFGHGDFDVTPVVSGPYSFYLIYISNIRLTKEIILSRSYHPALANAGVPESHGDYFTEYDPCIPDSAVVPNNTTTWTTSIPIIQDSVPVKVGFHIYDAANTTFPHPFNNISYKDLETDTELISLHSGTFANVKQVNSLPTIVTANGVYIQKGNTLAAQRSTVISNQPIFVWKHEIAHLLDAFHREDWVPASLYGDVRALMATLYNNSGTEVMELNRYERHRMENAPF